MDLYNLEYEEQHKNMTSKEEYEKFIQSMVLIIMAKALNLPHQWGYPTINRGVSSCYEVILSEMYPSI